MLELAKQISSVERAVRVDSSSLEAGLQQLDIGLKRVTAVVEQARKRNADVGPMDDRDPLPDIMHEFLVEAEPRLAELQVSNIRRDRRILSSQKTSYSLVSCYLTVVYRP